MLLRLSDKQVAAIEAVLDIALNSGTGAVPSSEITLRHGIPRRYLEPILQQLTRAGILVGVRGPHGGYRLARERRRITLGDLVRGTGAASNGGEPAPQTSRNGGNGGVVGAVLAELDAEILRRLDEITLDDLYRRVRTPERGKDPLSELHFAI